RALAVDRLVYLSLDRLALERLRRADAMEPVGKVVLRAVCKHNDRREDCTVLHRLRILLDELVVVPAHLRRAFRNDCRKTYLHRPLSNTERHIAQNTRPSIRSEITYFSMRSPPVEAIRQAVSVPSHMWATLGLCLRFKYFIPLSV